MNLVMQHPYPDACWLACLAMLVNSNIEEIVRIAGTAERWNFDGQDRVMKHFGLKLSRACVTEGYGDRCLGGLMRQHDYLVCTWSSCLRPEYAHCTVVHGGHNFDPWNGMDPSYSWDTYVSRVAVYER